MTPNLPELLLNSLNTQLGFYKQIYVLQNDLLRDLDSENQLNRIMELLEKKNALLDRVKEENTRNAPYVEEWVQRKAEMQSKPIFADIEQIISEIEKYVLDLRNQDEAMIKRFDEQSQSKNRIDAFRAMR